MEREAAQDSTPLKTILVTNDDGVEAKGIHLLAKALKGLGHTVWVIAPETNQTSKGQSVSFGHPIRVTRLDLADADLAFAVEGTPADCIRVAPGLLPSRPDVVLSGVNNGINVGADVFHSGTLGAAREAAFFGYHSAALSALEGADIQAMLARHLDAVLDLAMDVRGGVLSVNFPRAQGLERTVVPSGGQHYSEEVDVQETDSDHLEVDVRRVLFRNVQSSNTALGAVMRGKVAVTVLELPRAVRAEGPTESLRAGRVPAS